MPRLFSLTFTLLCLVGCSAITVGKCGPMTADFLSREEHRSMVIHPKGCYGSWAQTLSRFEAERRALLFCSETNPASDTRCGVVATDHSICPITLQDWVKERTVQPGENQRECKFGSPFIVRSAAGAEPPSVDDKANNAITDALTAFGLQDFDPGSGHTIVFGRSAESKSNWIITEALRFVPQKEGDNTCVFRLSSGWDPFEHFETVFSVHLIGCFENSENSG